MLSSREAPWRTVALLLAALTVAYLAGLGNRLVGPGPAGRKYDIVVFGAYGFLGTMGSAALVGLQDCPFKSIPKGTLMTTATRRGKIALVGRTPEKLYDLS